MITFNLVSTNLYLISVPVLLLLLFFHAHDRVQLKHYNCKIKYCTYIVKLVINEIDLFWPTVHRIDICYMQNNLVILNYARINIWLQNKKV